MGGGITSFTGGPSITEPFLLSIFRKPCRGRDEQPAVFRHAVAEPQVSEQLGQRVAGRDAVCVHVRRLREVDVGSRERLIIELIPQPDLPRDQVEHLTPRGFFDRHDDRTIQLLVDPGFDVGVSLRGQRRRLVVLLLFPFLEKSVGFFLVGFLGGGSVFLLSFQVQRLAARRATPPGNHPASARPPRRPGASGRSGFAGYIRQGPRECEAESAARARCHRR